MESSLAQNIRDFRKERKLTQEQLAEAMGVTAGAVYKWESGMSVPELSLLMSLATFFDISVDRLIGYKIKDNRPEEICKRLIDYCQNRDERALEEAENALKRYPNSLQIVKASAEVYTLFGIGKQDKARLRRSLELMERALLLVPECEDKESARLSILYDMSGTYMSLGEYEKSDNILQKNNVCGLFNDDIGINLALFMGKHAEGEKYLSKSIFQSVSQFSDSANGLAYIFIKRGDYSSAKDILTIAYNLIKMMGKANTPGFFHKVGALLLLVLSEACLKSGDLESAEKNIKEAYTLSCEFDEMPDYSANSVRFTKFTEPTFICDALGLTSEDSIEKMLEILDDYELTAMWQKEKNGLCKRKRNNDK